MTTLETNIKEDYGDIKLKKVKKLMDLHLLYFFESE
jgi:hypothetical protein